MAIEGTQQIVVTLVIDVPPSVPATQAVAMLSQGGISFAAGLLPYVRNINTEIRDKVEIEGKPKLHM